MNKTNLLMAAFLLSAASALAQNTPVSQMEKLGRGAVALPASGKGVFISWRFLGTDDEDRTTFDVIRNQLVVKSDLYATNYIDEGGSTSSSYRIVTKVDGEAVDTTEAIAVQNEVFKQVKLDRPAKGAQGGTYSPNDCSVGDMDGDGEYEIIVKWDPSNSKDNSQGGITDNVYLDCYKLDGTKLWRIDLGINIRAGAHYTQFMVYDFDGDGKAELMCKTAPGSKDGTDEYVNQAATDEKIKSASNSRNWRNGDGRIDGGQEYLTVFEGKTGKALHTIAYFPNRNTKAELSEATGSFNWDDRSGKSDYSNYGNRGERYLAAVAYLSGQDQNPSGIFCRGYYTYAYVWAVDFDGQQLKHRWLHRSDSKTQYSVVDANMTESAKVTAPKATSGSGSNTMYGNGNHNMSVADVDGDGRDEIIWGSAALDDDGTLLYATGFGHGDAIHLADHAPDHPGLEVFQVHEEKGTYAWDLHDAATGEILLKGGPEGVDNGRGMAGQFDADIRGSLFWSASDKAARSAVTGGEVSANSGSSNFRIYWDGDLQEELFDGGKIDKWNGNGTGRLYLNGKNLYDYNSSSTCNGSKSTPNLQADIFGDWREEVIEWSSADNATLNIFTTNTETGYRVPTLMHDHTYRMGVAWQNTAYNQPPHLGYYLPDAMRPQFVGTKELTVKPDEAIDWTLQWRYAKTVSITASYRPDGTQRRNFPPTGLSRDTDADNKKITFTGSLSEVGDYKIELKLTELVGSGSVTETLIIHVDDGTDGIENVASRQQGGKTVYDMQGRQRNEIKRGLNIVREGGKVKKVMAR